MVGGEIPIKHEDNIVIMEIEEGYEVNDDVNEEELIKYDEQGMRYAYVTDEDGSN